MSWLKENWFKICALLIGVLVAASFIHRNLTLKNLANEKANVERVVSADILQNEPVKNVSSSTPTVVNAEKQLLRQ